MATPTISVNLTITSAGAQPTSPVTLNANLISLVSQVNPGYTVLPGSLIADLSGTATYALALIDSAAVELVNSISPYTANPWITLQLGNMYGVSQGASVNTSVFVVFTSNTVGFQIPPGFLVTDGTNQYQVQSPGGAILVGGSSLPLYCVAVTAGSFPVPANSVHSLITQPPAGSGITLSCNNPTPGTPSAGAQTTEGYRAQVLAAGLVSGQGNASMARALVSNVPGVQPRLVSVAQVNGGGWEVIAGGGDPYAVANAIYNSGVDISTLVGSTIGIVSITKANPGIVTTNLNHGFPLGIQAGVVIAGCLGMTQANGTWTVNVLTPTTFSLQTDSTGFGTYTGGGVVTPNTRNISVNLNDYPDVYTVPYVNPPPEAVIIQLTWNTIQPNFTNSAAVAQFGAAALAQYINSIQVGPAPINLFDMQTVFAESVSNLVSTALLTRMVFTVTVNGVVVPPQSGTGIIAGDPESYFTTSPAAIIITQG